MREDWRLGTVLGLVIDQWLKWFPPIVGTTGSPMFSVICILHSVIALTCGSLIMFYLKEISVFGHGIEAAQKLSGSTPHDQMLIQTSSSFAGLLLVGVGFLLFMVSFVKEREFQSFFAKGCVLLHVAVALWRVYFERNLEVLASAWPRQVVGILLWHFHGFSFWCIPGERSMTNLTINSN
ncbi:Transmembrane protein [Quillaja saponaria]|uniref:Transmembrane protein n=1 Tax=Quillaja saponaria TaxID=32244 RepID=A0AAD7KYN7_QUISA|nr:Transmembrane protein [Quillaja saponaria]